MQVWPLWQAGRCAVCRPDWLDYDGTSRMHQPHLPVADVPQMRVREERVRVQSGQRIRASDMKLRRVEFDESELHHLIAYCQHWENSDQGGWYYGPRGHFERRHIRIREKLVQALNAETVTG